MPQKEIQKDISQ